MQTFLHPGLDRDTMFGTEEVLGMVLLVELLPIAQQRMGIGRREGARSTMDIVGGGFAYVRLAVKRHWRAYWQLRAV